MTGSPTAWMPLYVGDYLGDTQRLTTEQHGAYLLLILDYWRTGPAPDDDAVLAQIARLDARGWKRTRPILARMFDIEGGEWRHKRIERELEAAKANAERRSKSAKKAADARWSQSDEHASRTAPRMRDAMPRECAPPSPSPTEEEEEGKTAVALQNPRESSSGKFAFAGGTVRLNSADLEQWRQSYHAIPDLEAELRSIDQWFASNPAKAAKWFVSTSGMLNRKHQSMLAEQQKADAGTDGHFRFCGTRMNSPC